MKGKTGIILIGVLLLTACGKHTSEEIKPQSTEITAVGESQVTEENTEAKKEKVETGTVGKIENGAEIDSMRKAFQKVLTDLTEKHVLADGTEVEWFDDFDMSMDSYALCDVDGDGKEELLISYGESASMAGKMEIVYGYDAEKDMVCEEYMGFPTITFYTGGKIVEEWSHNQTMSEVWPLSFVQYKSDANQYESIGSMYAWDAAFGEVAYGKGEMPFPKEIDVDQNGTVYFLTLGEVEQTIDDAAYEKWYNGFLNGGTEIKPEWSSLTRDNIQEITK